jgi:putative ABC transport system substrate-binding protein
MRRREFIAGLGGAAAAWPLAVGAQQPALPVIGYLSGGTESGDQSFTDAFRQGLNEQGYVERRNVEILYRWAEMRNDRLPALAADLVDRRVAIIVATRGNAPALAALSASKTIPIVFSIGADPVELSLVASLNRPGGNVTGLTVLTKTLTTKRLELLHGIVPAAKSIGFLVNPTAPQVETETREAEIAARILGIRVVFANASSPNEIEAAFGTLVGQRVDAFLTAADPVFWTQLAGLAARNGVPAIYNAREIVLAGGLMSYGATFSDSIRLAGTYAGRILKGEKPADLPVQQSTKVELVINVKTAKALGLTIPETLLATADEVIE